MYAVIFKAEVAVFDEEYSITAEKMRNLAIDEYGCLEFTACTEGNKEIAISYWESEDQISAWKSNTDHIAAQKKGREKWYKSYKIEIVEIKREYGSNT